MRFTGCSRSTSNVKFDHGEGSIIKQNIEPLDLDAASRQDALAVVEPLDLQIMHFLGSNCCHAVFLARKFFLVYFVAPSQYYECVEMPHLRRGMPHHQTVEDRWQLVEDVLVFELTHEPGRERHTAAARSKIIVR